MSIQVGKYMHAEPLGSSPHEVYTIHARDGSILGSAEWYPQWRGYVFEPEEAVALSWDCCLELSRFLASCNKATKALKERPKNGLYMG